MAHRCTEETKIMHSRYPAGRTVFVATTALALLCASTQVLPQAALAQENATGNSLTETARIPFNIPTQADRKSVV